MHIQHLRYTFCPLPYKTLLIRFCCSSHFVEKAFFLYSPIKTYFTTSEGKCNYYPSIWPGLVVQPQIFNNTNLRGTQYKRNVLRNFLENREMRKEGGICNIYCPFSIKLFFSQAVFFHKLLKSTCTSPCG